MKLALDVARLETEFDARGEVIKALRQEREDHLAASLRIRARLAPLLGCDVNNELADEMVGRLAALYEARDERVAEKRGHDKALLWAATLADAFDPFSAEWNDEQRIAGERALGLFAERLRDEWTAAVTANGSCCIRDDGVEIRRTATGFVDDAPHAAGWTPCPTCRVPIRGSVEQGTGSIRDTFGPHSCKVDSIRRAVLEKGPLPQPTETTSWGVSERLPVFAPNEWTSLETVSFVLPRPGKVRVAAGALVSGGQVGVSCDADEPGFVAVMGLFGLYTAETMVTLSKGYHSFTLLGRGGATVTDRKLTVALLPVGEEGE